MNIREFAHTEYKLYCRAEGSEHIVSEFALNKILEIAKKYEVKSILEVGVGIGTISGSLIKLANKENLDIQFTGIEENSFCLSQIPMNLGKAAPALKIFPKVSALPANLQFDLVIVDGGEKELKEIEHKITAHAVILVEGDRSEQVETIKNVFPKSKYAQFISLKRNGNYSVKRSEDFRGGLKVIFPNPTRKQLFHWLRIKILTAAKYRIRRFLQ